jgi:hypothetical protein
MVTRAKTCGNPEAAFALSNASKRAGSLFIFRSSPAVPPPGSSEGQKTAQREMATVLETALDARRQRIIISQSQVNLLKWLCLFLQAVCALVAIAMVHSDNRLASTIALGIFATGVAASMLLILAHDRPFVGEISIRPDALLQVMPEIGS